MRDPKKSKLDWLALAEVRRAIEALRRDVERAIPGSKASRFVYTASVVAFASRAGLRLVGYGRIRRLIALGVLEKEYDGSGCGDSIALRESKPPKSLVVDDCYSG